VAASNSKNSEKADFVTDGTGGTDDATTIESAISALPSGVGGVVVLLEGTYYLNSTLDISSDYVTLTGTGKGTKILREFGTANSNLISASSRNGVTVSNLFVDGNRTTYSAVDYGANIYIASSDNTKVLNTWSDNSDGYGIRANDEGYHSNILISENHLYNNEFGVAVTQAYETSQGIVISNNNIDSSTWLGTEIGSSAYVVFDGNTISQTAGDWGGMIIQNAESKYNIISNNIFKSGTGWAEGLRVDSDSNTIIGNTFDSNAQEGMTVTGNRNVISSNIFTQNTADGLYINGGDFNQITGNTIYNNGGDGIEILNDADNNSITSNTITDTAGSTYAINISASTCNSTYLSDNTYSGTGAANITDSGTGTVYGGQLANSGSDLALKPTGAVTVGTAASGIGKLFVQGTAVGKALSIFDYTGTDQNILTASASGTTVMNLDQSGNLSLLSQADLRLYDSDNSNYVAFQAPALSSDYTFTLPADDGTLNQVLTTNGSGVLTWATVGAPPGASLWQENAGTISPYSLTAEINLGATATASAKISLAGSLTRGMAAAIINQTESQPIFAASASGTTRFVINNDGTYTTMPITSSTSTQEGTIYYDSDDDQLKVYANGKWQADRTTAAVIVAASDSKNKEKADFVGDGTDDQVEINAAIAALPSTGGTVVLLDGTYNIGTTATTPRNISITVGNITFIGQGSNTILKRDWNNASSATYVLDINANSASEQLSGLYIGNFTVDGNKSTHTSELNSNIRIYSGSTYYVADSKFTRITSQNNAMGDSWLLTGSYTRNNVFDSNVIKDNDGPGLSGSSLYPNTFTNNAFVNNVANSGAYGWQWYVGSANYWTISNNIFSAVGTYAVGGIYLMGNYNTLDSNIFYGSGQGYGIAIGSLTNSIISNNIIRGTNDTGIYVSDADGAVSYNVITGNSIYGVATSASHGIYLTGSTTDSNSVIGNFINDTAGTGYAIKIDSGADYNYLADNNYSGTGASNISDGATTTIYGGQLANSGTDLALKPAGAVTIGTTTSPTGKLFVSGTAVGKALAAFNETGANDILTASASGTTRFTVNNAGNTFVTLRSTATYALCHVNNDAGFDEITDCSGSVGADYMEIYPVDPAADLGTIVVSGPASTQTTDGDSISVLTPATSEYQSNVIGIVSDKSKAGDFNSIGYNIKDSDNPQPIALSGRVQVKIASDSPAVSAGDYLTTSGSQPGKAKKATQAGFVVGKALESWNPQSPASTILVYVTNTWADPNRSLAFDASGNLFVKGITSATDVSVKTASASEPEVTLTSLNSRLLSVDTQIASISAQLAGLNSASVSASLAEISVSSLDVLGDATISGQLHVTAQSVLSDTTITGKLLVGLLKFDDLSADLSSLSGLLSLQNGAATLTDTGDLTITGTLTAKAVKAEQFQVLGTATSSASIGKATLPAGTTELTIATSVAATSSAIFVTPDQPVSTSAVATDSGRFTIRIPSALPNDLNVNWWIIN
jgi:parallel beta-helix repeat protein